ncbi:MAG: caspase family protein [Armatimonadota bacterium]
MLAASIGGQVELFDPDDGRPVRTLVGRPALNTSATASPDAAMVSVSGQAGTWLWDLSTAQPRPVIAGAYQPLDEGVASGAPEMVFSPDGSTGAVRTSSGKVAVCDVRTGQVIARLDCSGIPAGFSPDADLVAILHRGGPSSSTALHTTRGRDVITLWDVARQSLRATLDPAQNLLFFSPDGTYLLTRDWDACWIWDVREGEPRTVLPYAGAASTSCAPDGSSFACLSTTARASVSLYDLPSGELLGGVPESSLHAFSPNSALLAVATQESDAGEITVIDAQTGSEGWSAPVDAGTPITLAFSPDARLLAVCCVPASEDKVVIQLFSADDGQPVGVLTAGKPLGVAPRRDLSVVFSRDGQTVALRDRGYPPFLGLTAAAPPAMSLWDVSTGENVSPGLEEILDQFPFDYSRPSTIAGSSVTVHEPLSGRRLATMVLLPPAGVPARGERPIEIDARPIEIDARPIEFDARGGLGAGAEWFVGTPEGYFDCSVNGARFIMWNVGGELYPAERFIKRFRRPDLVRRALAGEAIDAQAMTVDDIPPTARFVGLTSGDRVSGDRLQFAVEVTGARQTGGVELLVNGRPPVREEQVPQRASATTAGNLVVTRLDYDLSLPRGCSEIHLRALAWDDAEIASAPVMVELKRPGTEPVTGSLYVLSVGVDRYAYAAHFEQGQRAAPAQLAFAAGDAQAIADRLSAEGPPLWHEVHVRTLVDEQATLTAVREALGWLRSTVRPGNVDTVVVFLSGHGYSSPEGCYAFAPYDFDPKRPDQTGLSADEMREALGGGLCARHVFLLVDTCHAGALSCRNDDLAIEIGNGVHFLASCGMGQFALESPDWGHGAFTRALLQTLSERGDLAPKDGRVDYSELVIGVRREIAALMDEAGQGQGGQAPCVLFPGLDTGAVIAAVGGAEVE